MLSDMNVLIIEDETAAAVNLKALLHSGFPEMNILRVLESVADSIEWLNANHSPALIFLDIHLADGDAFRIFEKVNVHCPIIFTTAYDQYALEAFKLNSIDYLLKPVRQTDLQRAIDKLKLLGSMQIRDYSQRINEMARERLTQSFLIHVRDRLVPLKIDEIAFCYTFEERVSAYTLKGDVFPLDKTLETLSGLLPKERFFRANRQFIISRLAVADISVWFGSRLAVNTVVPAPEKIIISKARVPEFKEWFTGI